MISDLTHDVARGVCRLLEDQGLAPVLEVGLPTGRRLDVVAVSETGEITVVEIKVSLEDLRADRKWETYLDYSDRFFFAVPEDFPHEALPSTHGLIVADRFGGAVVRESSVDPMAPARRRSMLLRIARAAAQRLRRLEDPERL
ncbi:MAG: MmcB family DNA repair protein [Alphaproteobacteria bacterium]|nr:MmcB family DNA repair protein [Alphaproteobacteria bacterium]